MTEPVVFTPKSAARIAKATRGFEAQTPPSNSRPSQYRPGPDGFWAKITSVDYATSQYAWTKQKPVDDGTFEDDDLEGTTEDLYAIEVKGFKFVPINSIVWLTKRHQYFVFEWDGRYVLGKADANIAANASGTVSVHTAAVVDTTQNITVTNKTGSAINQNDFVMCFLVGAVWFAEAGGSGRFLEFDLPSALTTAQATKASCTVVAYWGGANPGSTVTVYNLAQATNYLFKGDIGDNGLAVWDTTLERWRIISLNTSGDGETSWFCQFQLSAIKAPTAHTAFSAIVQEYWGNGDPGATIDVLDNPLVGGLYAHRGDTGDRGIAVYDDSNEVWRILNLRPTVPREFLATLGATLQIGDPNATIGSLVALDDSVAPSVTSAANMFGLACPNTGVVLVQENLSSATYFVKQVIHQQKVVLIDIDYDTGDHKLKQDYITVSLCYDGVSGPTTEDIMTMVSKEVVIDVSADASALGQTVATIYVPEAGSGSAETVWEMTLGEFVTTVDVSPPVLYRESAGAVVWAVGEGSGPITIDTGTDCEVEEEE